MMDSFSNMKYINGLNSFFFNSNDIVPKNIASLGYKADLINNFNYMAILLILPILLSLFVYLTKYIGL